MGTAHRLAVAAIALLALASAITLVPSEPAHWYEWYGAEPGVSWRWCDAVPASWLVVVGEERWFDRGRVTWWPYSAQLLLSSAVALVALGRLLIGRARPLRAPAMLALATGMALAGSLLLRPVRLATYDSCAADPKTPIFVGDCEMRWVWDWHLSDANEGYSDYEVWWSVVACTQVALLAIGGCLVVVTLRRRRGVGS